MDTKVYWQAVRRISDEIEKDLTEKGLKTDSVWLYPLTNDTKGTHEHSLSAKGDNDGPPLLTEASPRIAAMRIVERTHRIAKKDEIELFMGQREERSRRTIAKEQARAMKNITLTPDQFVAALRGVLPEMVNPDSPHATAKPKKTSEPPAAA